MPASTTLPTSSSHLPSSRSFSITPQISVGGSSALLLIAGPCQIESETHACSMAEAIIQATKGLPVGLVYKSSYDKANRTSITGARGIGIEDGLDILAKVRSRYGIPVLTDVHDVTQVEQVGKVVDVLQIPAFLCRQTDLLVAAGKSGKAVNVKKGQFLAPQDMQHVAAKVASAGSEKIMLCERGSCFGYRDLVVDMRALVIMRETGYPVVFDATHSVQNMGGAGGSSGGSREFVYPLLRAAVAVGVDAVFIECHENPDKAPSDGASMLPVAELRWILERLVKIRDAAR